MTQQLVRNKLIPLHYASVSMTDKTFTGVDDPVIFDTTHDDTGSIVTNSTTITIAQDGKYMINVSASLDMDEASGGDRYIILVKNNVAPVSDAAALASEITNSHAYADSPPGVSAASISVVTDLVAGDTLITYFEGASAGDKVTTCHMTVSQLPTNL